MVKTLLNWLKALLNKPPLPEGVERRYESKESLFRGGARNPITDAKSAVNAERAYMSNFLMQINIILLVIIVSLVLVALSGKPTLSGIIITLTDKK